MTDQSLARFQGAFYLATGVWPLLHMRSFLRVTGLKTDLWLVQTVGLLVSCIGAQMLMASRRERVTPEVRALAASAALSLAAIDTVHSAKGTISPIYLLDAAVEIGLAGLWARKIPPHDSN
ncbi:MAG TPA: hypothetical protein VES20_14325 [Bryobacteraceae bacterium]|nr:hypothetical protein [Bryobacteraceae bacterium]